MASKHRNHVASGTYRRLDKIRIVFVSNAIITYLCKQMQQIHVIASGFFILSVIYYWAIEAKMKTEKC